MGVAAIAFARRCIDLSIFFKILFSIIYIYTCHIFAVHIKDISEHEWHADIIGSRNRA